MSDDDAPTGPPALAWANFALMAIGGLALLAWLWSFTDWLGTAMVVVGLGGILAWPRSLIGWVPGIGKGLETAISRAVASRVMLVLLVAALAGGLVASCFLGSVAVRSLEADDARRLVFRPAGGLPTAQLFAGDVEVRRPFWTSWGRPLRVGVEVGGYPPTEVDVHPWRRTRLIVPDDLRRPIVLLRPGIELTFAVSGALKDEGREVELVVALPGGDEPRRMDYAGRAVWIGCTADCDIPERFAREWESQPAVLAWRWLTPVQLDGELPRLTAGDRLQATVTIDGETVAETTFVVRGGDEPQM
ncbi:MAG TPA: hypothetical protein VKU40_10555, partial [Thermoanaerobaculia bacterium]|nr:hypothetical protein [Thermoanaerobaculia bacterium]